MEESERDKRDILRDQVVDLVIDFVNKEGGLSQYDLQALFGEPHSRSSVAAALHKVPINFSQDP
jgi:hypothetical protein